MRTEHTQGMKVYSPRQRDMETAPPYRNDVEEPIAVQEADYAEPDVPYDTDIAAGSTDTAAPLWDTMAEPSAEEETVAAMTQDPYSGRHAEGNRLLGEVFSALFRNLRREDWLLVALLALFLLDGSASPDVLLLLAVLLAYRA